MASSAEVWRREFAADSEGLVIGEKLGAGNAPEPSRSNGRGESPRILPAEWLRNRGGFGASSSLGDISPVEGLLLSGCGVGSGTVVKVRKYGVCL